MGKAYRELPLLETGDNVTCAHAGRILGRENEEMTIIAMHALHVVQTSVLQLCSKMLPQVSLPL
jgi:hypothetical protein